MVSGDRYRAGEHNPRDPACARCVEDILRSRNVRLVQQVHRAPPVLRHCSRWNTTSHPDIARRSESTSMMSPITSSGSRPSRAVSRDETGAMHAQSNHVPTGLQRC